MHASDEFERLITEEQIQFQNVPSRALEAWGRALVSTFLTPANIKWKMGSVKVGQSYCLQIEDDLVGYLDIHPEQETFLWCSKDHHSSIHPDIASAYLLIKATPGLQVRCVIDDNTGMRTMDLILPNGLKFRCKDYDKDGERVIEFEQLD